MDRKKTQKQNKSFLKRLAQESVFLSCTSFLSDKIVGMFETGIFSFFIKSCKKTDSFVHDKLYLPVDKKTGFHDKVTNNLRRKISLFFDRFPLFALLRRLQSELTDLSLRSLGAFLAAFGVSSGAMFFLQRYVLVTGGKADPDNLSFSALIFLAGVILLIFGSKNAVDAFCSSRLTGYPLSCCFGLNEAVLRRERGAKNHGGTMLFFGACYGAFALIAPMSLLLKILILAPLALLTFNIPEFGLLVSLALMHVLSAKLLAGAVLLTLVSYLIKYIRMKRNIHFGTAGTCVLFALATVLAAGALAEHESRFYGYAAIFVCLYFLAKNLICSRSLVRHTVNCLCLSANLGMLCYIVSYFCSYIPSENLYRSVQGLVSNSLPSQYLGVFVGCMLPFALISFSSEGSKKMALFQLLLSVACTVLSDNYAMYMTVFLSFLVYVSVGCKAPAGALLCGLILIPPMSIFASGYAWATAESGLLTGIISGAESIMEANSFLTGMYRHGGIILCVIFALIVIFSAQRLFGCISMAKDTRAVKKGGAVAACGTVLLVSGWFLNLYSDIRLYGLVWFVVGFAGSLFTVYVQNEKEENWGRYVL